MSQNGSSFAGATGVLFAGKKSRYFRTDKLANSKLVVSYDITLAGNVARNGE